jgi:hypothetical protein
MCRLHIQNCCLEETTTLGEGGKTCYSSLSIGEEKDRSIWFCNYYIFWFHKPIEETCWCLAKFLEVFGALYLKGLKAFAHLWKHLALEVNIHQFPYVQFSSQSSVVDKILPTMVEKTNGPTCLSNLTSTIVVFTNFVLWIHYAKTWQICLHRWLGLYFATMYFMIVVIKHISNFPYQSI